VVRLFVTAGQDRARLPAGLPAAGGMPTLAGRWSDKVFARLRRLLGLGTELLVLLAVATDHGAGLGQLRVGRLRFVADVMASPKGVVSAVLTPVPHPAPVPRRGAREPCRTPIIGRTLPTHRHMGRVDGGSPHVR
jgi:hypothetical protein